MYVFLRIEKISERKKMKEVDAKHLLFLWGNKLRSSIGLALSNLESLLCRMCKFVHSKQEEGCRK